VNHINLLLELSMISGQAWNTLYSRKLWGSSHHLSFTKKSLRDGHFWPSHIFYQDRLEICPAFLKRRKRRASAKTQRAIQPDSTGKHQNEPGRSGQSWSANHLGKFSQILSDSYILIPPKKTVNYQNSSLVVLGCSLASLFWRCYDVLGRFLLYQRIPTIIYGMSPRLNQSVRYQFFQCIVDQRQLKPYYSIFIYVPRVYKHSWKNSYFKWFSLQKVNHGLKDILVAIICPEVESGETKQVSTWGTIRLIWSGEKTGKTPELRRFCLIIVMIFSRSQQKDMAFVSQL
jgi:hypothetical protein